MVKKSFEDSGIDTNDDVSIQIIKRDVQYLQERIERETPSNLSARLSLLEKSLLVLENNVNRDLPKINELTNDIGIIKQKQYDLDRNMKYYLILVGVIASLLTIIAMMFGNVLGGK
jgi:hypothetical protein